MDDLPFRVEYAKSARSRCKGCNELIEKDVLRLAVMVQSPVFDGKTPRWFHYDCFFKRQRINSISDIAHFESIRQNDQERIQQSIEQGSSQKISTPAGKGGGKKRKSVQTVNKDFTIQYSKSSRAVCLGCQEKIIKGDIRISKKDYESEEGRKFGGLDRWYHVDCFVKLRNELGYYGSAEGLSDFSTISPEHQGEIKEKIPKISAPAIDETDGASKPKKSKTEDKEYKKQNDIIFKFRDELMHLKKPELLLLLEHNNQKIPSGKDSILDRLADAMTFGALLPCDNCNGQYVFRSGVGYYCIGYKDEWMKCESVSLDPKRNEFKVPEELKKHEFLESYKFIPRKRIFKNIASTSKSTNSSAEVNSRIKKVDSFVPFKNMAFGIFGFPQEKKAKIEFELAKLGGKMTSKVRGDMTGIIATEEYIKKKDKKLRTAESHGIQVVSEDFISEVKKGGKPLELLVKMNLVSWGYNPAARVMQEKEESRQRKTLGEKKHEKRKVQIKGGAVVDPDSGLEDQAHVYRKDNVIYNTALCLTDLQTGKNSYYKMQILEADVGRRYWCFKSWGRIGTNVGGTKLEETDDVTAIYEFKYQFEKKTGNEWENRENFVKLPGKMVLMDVSYDVPDSAVMQSDIPSKLHPNIQDLMSLIFNVDTMKNLMLEYELDYDKMPLGKLSKKQIEAAYSVLTKLQRYIETSGDSDLKDCTGYTNQFYTLIPHSFGINNPPIINNLKMVEEKRMILDNLLEMEIAYSLMNQPVQGTSDTHYLDQCYEKLNAHIEVVEEESDEFKLLRKYVKNTHAETHSSYSLEIDQVYRVKRSEEERRFKPFRKLHNRKLLWHGSRLTNFAGILSQGLRIAPKEAPSTGYMFGKGIYFADMVSKSANYCCTSRKNETGLLLLCEVALGDMYERLNADYIEKLPPGKHSCKGVGQTAPNPLEKHIRPDGVEIPFGKGMPTKVKKSSLLYNEYIVYDVAQVNIQYLLKLKFV